MAVSEFLRLYWFPALSQIKCLNKYGALAIEWLLQKLDKNLGKDKPKYTDQWEAEVKRRAGLNGEEGKSQVIKYAKQDPEQGATWTALYPITPLFGWKDISHAECMYALCRADTALEDVKRQELEFHARATMKFQAECFMIILDGGKKVERWVDWQLRLDIELANQSKGSVLRMSAGVIMALL